MHSVRDNFKQQDLEAAIAAFAYRQPSSLLDHRRDCCLIAKEWFLAMDRGLRRNGSVTEVPGWLREHFEWGPARWPLHWCEAIQRDVLDCGGLAAFARESFKAQGVIALPTHLIRLYSEEDAAHWKAEWQNKGYSADWICGAYIYHEAAGVVQGKTIQVWEPTENLWLDPELRLGYTGTVAIRVIAMSPKLPHILEWGRYHLLVNSWKSILDC